MDAHTTVHSKNAPLTVFFTTSAKVQKVVGLANLFAKRGVEQLFFRMPRLDLKHVLQQRVEEAAAESALG